MNKHFILFVGTLVFTSLFSSPAKAMIFDFEDVYDVQSAKSDINGPNSGFLFSDYKGVVWDNYGYFRKGVTPYDWPVNGFTTGVDGNYAISNAPNGGNTHIRMADDASFDFNGADFTSGYWDNQYLQINGYALNPFGAQEIKYHQTFLISAYQPKTLNLDYQDINALEIYGFQGPNEEDPGSAPDLGVRTETFEHPNASILVDNFRINDGFNEEPHVVPEPSTMALMGGGMLASAFWRRRKKTQ